MKNNNNKKPKKTPHSGRAKMTDHTKVTKNVVNLHPQQCVYQISTF